MTQPSLFCSGAITVAGMHGSNEIRLPRSFREMKEQLLAFMEKHKFEKLSDFKGHSVQYFTTHARSSRSPSASLAPRRKPSTSARKGIRSDAEWEGDDFVKQTEAPRARG